MRALARSDDDDEDDDDDDDDDDGCSDDCRCLIADLFARNIDTVPRLDQRSRPVVVEASVVLSSRPTFQLVAATVAICPTVHSSKSPFRQQPAPRDDHVVMTMIRTG